MDAYASKPEQRREGALNGEREEERERTVEKKSEPEILKENQPRRTNRDSRDNHVEPAEVQDPVDGRGRIQHILAAVQENKWDIVLLSEISSKEEGYGGTKKTQF